MCYVESGVSKFGYGSILAILFSLQHLRGVSNVLEQRFLQGEQMNNVQVHISRKW
jgi:hypothetical protein